MEKFIDIRGFSGLKMNLDASDELLGANELREVRNMIQESGSSHLVNMKGFESVMALNPGFEMPAGTFKCIAADKDIEANAIDYFLCDTVGTSHSILRMDIDTKVLTWILRAEPLLNFQPNFRISTDAIEGLRYWTDGYFGSFLNNDFNPPRKINISKAIAYTAAMNGQSVWSFTAVSEASYLTSNVAYYGMTAFIGVDANQLFDINDKVVSFGLDGINRNKKHTGYGIVKETYFDSGSNIVITDRPWQETDIVEMPLSGHILPYAPGQYFGIDWQVLDVIKYPPVFKPGVSFDDDGENTTNTLKKNLYQFRYRWIYDDNETSVFSSVSYIPISNFEETTFGTIGNQFYLKDNVVHVWVDTGPMEVKTIQIAVRKSNIGNWILVDEKSKYDLNVFFFLYLNFFFFFF